MLLLQFQYIGTFTTSFILNQRKNRIMTTTINIIKTVQKTQKM